MTEPEVTTRKATTAERLAACALGHSEVDEVDTTPTEQVRPEGMSAAEWHAARYRGRGPDTA